MCVASHALLTKFIGTLKARKVELKLFFSTRTLFRASFKLLLLFLKSSVEKTKTHKKSASLVIMYLLHKNSTDSLDVNDVSNSCLDVTPTVNGLL